MKTRFAGMKKLTVHKKKKEGPIVNHNVWVSIKILLKYLTFR